MYSRCPHGFLFFKNHAFFLLKHSLQLTHSLARPEACTFFESEDVALLSRNVNFHFFRIKIDSSSDDFQPDTQSTKELKIMEWFCNCNESTQFVTNIE